MEHEDPNNIRAIQEQLTRVLYQAGSTGNGARGVTLSELERTAFVCAGSPKTGGRKTSASAGFIRGVMFRLTRWYVEPFVVQQRSFNLSLMRYIAVLEERVAKLESDRPEGGA